MRHGVITFIFDTGSPVTIILGEASSALGQKKKYFDVKIMGITIIAQQDEPKGPFEDVNLLGNDFLDA